MKGFTAILDELEALRKPAVLATLVRVKGSSYRAPGARMLLGPEGARTGSVSAGCMETDLALRAKSALETDSVSLVKYELGSELDLIWGTGMGCEGVAEVLLEPLRPGRMHPWVPVSRQILRQRKSGVLATVFAVEGETGCEVGEHFLLDDHLHGVMPVNLDLAKALEQKAQEVLQSKRAQWCQMELPKGRLEVCLEALLPPLALWIYNGGETAKPLAELAARAGWCVNILDHRPALATSERFPAAQQVLAGFPGETIPGLPLDERSAAVVMTHVYERDKEALRCFLESGVAYVGLQGNRRRSERLVRELEEEGLCLDETRRGKLYWPVGLDIGAESPEAIALSILAEAHAVLTGHGGGHLRDGRGSIHG